MTMRKRCACIFAPTSGGGHARYAWELATALARHPRAESRVELVSSRNLDCAFRSAAYPVHPILPPLSQRAAFGSTAGWVWNRLTHYPAREAQFLEWLRGRPDVDVVHLQEWKPWLARAVIRRMQRLGKKVFYTVHNVLPHRYPPGVPRRLMHHWVRRACRQCDGLFVHTDPLAAELARFLGEGHPPITVVPHGVWTVEGAAAAASPADGLARRRLLFFGAIRRNKGLDLLLRAMRHLPRYALTVAGEPVERAYFENQIVPQVAALRAAGVRVELVDRFVPDDEVGPLFSTHSAIVLPYTRQFVAQSGVVFMALAYGLPVVASTAGGLRDLLGEYPVGTTFDGQSPEALAAAVEALHATERKEELERQMLAARRRFTWQAAAAATLGGYAAAMNEPVTDLNDCALGTTPAH